MPIVITNPHQGAQIAGGPGRRRVSPSKDMDFSQLYDPLYPEGTRLKPGTRVHDELVGEIMARAQESEREMTKLHPKWDQIDQMFTAFIPQSDMEKDRKSKDIRKPTSIVVPESFAVRETFTTYAMTVFGDYPTMRYEGVGPEDTLGSILMEKVVDVQSRQKSSLLALQTQYNDAFGYGFGVVSIDWQVEMGRRTAVQDEFIIDPQSGKEILLETTRVPVDEIRFEGSVIQPIDPRKYLPDPSVRLSEPQSGEYVGWLGERENYMSLLRLENQPGSLFFNVRYLRTTNGHSSIYAHQTKTRNPSYLGNQNDERTKSEGSNVIQPIDLLWMYIDLVPAEWNLGESELPEKWVFCLANDTIIVVAGKMDNHHNMFPIAVAAPDESGHEHAPVSRVEIMFGLQEVMNFYLNSHVEESLKFLRNHLVVDPMLVNMDDVKRNKGIIKTRHANWGRGVENAIKQLSMQDITRTHLSDLAAVTGIARSTTGAVDTAQGIQRVRGERVTKGEFEATRGSALSKLQRAAQTISLQSMRPLGLMSAYHVQQYMSQDVWVKTAGRTEEVLRQEYAIEDPHIKVSPFDLNVAFDLLVSDGTIVGGEDPNAWIQFLQVAANLPGVMQSYNSRAIALHLARLMGNKNPEQFLREQPTGAPPVDVQTAPDDQVADQAASGDLLPIGEEF